MNLLEIALSLIVFGAVLLGFVATVNPPINPGTGEGGGWVLAGIFGFIMIFAGIICFIIRLLQVMF